MGWTIQLSSERFFSLLMCVCVYPFGHIPLIAMQRKRGSTLTL